MARKPFNPTSDPASALTFILSMLPRENIQQGLKAISVIKAAIDDVARLTSENELIKAQLQSAVDEKRAIEEELQNAYIAIDPVEKPRRGRKPGAKNADSNSE